jgi:hypothetical protein
MNMRSLTDLDTCGNHDSRSLLSQHRPPNVPKSQKYITPSQQRLSPDTLEDDKAADNETQVEEQSPKNEQKRRPLPSPCSKTDHLTATLIITVNQKVEECSEVVFNSSQWFEDQRP